MGWTCWRSGSIGLMDQQDFISNNILRASELDTLQANVQAADDAQAVDGDMIGVVRGLTVSPVSGTLINVSPGAAHNKSTGRRSVVDTTGQIDAGFADQDTTPVPTTVTVIGESKTLALFIRPQTDPQTPIPGSPTTVLEGHILFIRQSAQGVSPTPPALLSDAILLADITRYEASVQPDILAGDIDLSRRESSVKLVQATLGMPVESSSFRGALQVLIDRLAQDGTDPAPNNVAGAEYVNATTGKTSTVWTLADGTVDDQLASIVTDIGTGDGAANVSSTARASTNLTLALGTLSSQFASLVGQLGEVEGEQHVGADSKTIGLLTLSAGTLESQISALLTFLDNSTKRTQSYAFVSAGQAYTGTANGGLNRRVLVAATVTTGVTLPLDVLEPGDTIVSVTAYLNKVDVAQATATVIVEDNTLPSTASNTQTNVLAGAQTLVLNAGFDATFFPYTVGVGEILFLQVTTGAIGDQYVLAEVQYDRDIT